MAIDMRRVVHALIESAPSPSTPAKKSKKPRLSGGRAILLGAGMMTAGRMLARSSAGALRHRLAETLEDLEEKLEGDRGLEDDYEEEPDALDEDGAVAEDESLDDDEDEDGEEPEAEEDDIEADDDDDEPKAADEPGDEDILRPRPRRRVVSRARARRLTPR